MRSTARLAYPVAGTSTRLPRHGAEVAQTPDDAGALVAQDTPHAAAATSATAQKPARSVAAIASGVSKISSLPSCFSRK